MQSIITDNQNCYLCGGIASDTHHCLMGNKRLLCDKYGLTVRLCRKCHMMIHNPRTDQEKGLQTYLKRVAQTTFEDQIGNRDDFIKIFGRNYL